MTKPTLTFLCALVCATVFRAAAASQEWTLDNQEKALSFTLTLDAGRLSYRLRHSANGKIVPVIESSPLGLVRRDQTFVADLDFVSAGRKRTLDERYTMVSGKQSRLRNHCREQTFDFRNAAGAALQIVVRVYADGAAFAYRYRKHIGSGS